jgi:Xaa-Pro aminopeptidase
VTLVELDALPAMDVAGRADRLRPAFADAGIDALLVTHLPNVRYLTGFTGSSAMLLVTDDVLVFTSDGRYRTQAGEQLGDAGVDARIEIGATVAQQREALAAALASGARVGLEANAVTWAQQRAFVGALDGHELVPTDGLVERLRAPWMASTRSPSWFDCRCSSS